MPRSETREHRRLRDSEQRKADWKRWGPYLAERAWGTVREDYSSTGDAWTAFPHDHARSRAYRWNEDGIGGFCNRFQNICLAVALWNGKDPILKERFFGVAGSEGNHGEDVKELYFYLDGTPTHSFMRMLYRYPQEEYPYQALVEQGQGRSRDEDELEIEDILQESLAQGRTFDVLIDWAKKDPEDLLCRIQVTNRGPDPAPIHVLPHLWFRNTWSWGHKPDRPVIRAASAARTVPGTLVNPSNGPGPLVAECEHRHLGHRYWAVESPSSPSHPPRLLFTDNDTNNARLFGTENTSRFVKDGINDAVVHGREEGLNPEARGTKAAAWIQATLPPGGSLEVRVRFRDRPFDSSPFADFEETMRTRISEANEFWSAVQSPTLDDDECNIQRQSLAGLLWSKQFYHYGVQLWLDGDPGQPPPPDARRSGRNRDWQHVYCVDVLSMPDKWEYPWFAAWDLAFHTLPLALVDPEWARRQLLLLLREWYTHPNGQIPAYEWNFSDTNPPVHAWAALRVYRLIRDTTGKAETVFLERVFQKLLMNFTWWVNRKDSFGNNIFQGGFLGLDNIGVFNRSELPEGIRLEQADGTAWMGLFCLDMLVIALELAKTSPAYEDMATKFFEHFVLISHAINQTCGHVGLWNPETEFYNDLLVTGDGTSMPVAVRSSVGLIPLMATRAIEPEVLEELPRFRRRMEWFIEHRPHLVEGMASLTERGHGGRILLSIAGRKRLEKVLAHVFDESKFLSPYGLRSLSREHAEHPYSMKLDGQTFGLEYEPGESRTGLFGGNSNWRGPIWMPLNALLLEALMESYRYYGNDLTLELPTGSGQRADLEEAEVELTRRLIALFARNENGGRAFHGGNPLFAKLVSAEAGGVEPLLFHEYFHADNGKGLGASHQTGWTSMVGLLLYRAGERREKGKRAP